MRRSQTAGGQGKSGEKPARSRHCDRAEDQKAAPPLRVRGRLWGCCIATGEPPAPWEGAAVEPGSQETCPRPAKTTLEEGVAEMRITIWIATLASLLVPAWLGSASADASVGADLRVV